MATDIIDAAVQYIQRGTGPTPVPTDLVAALLAAEKQSKRAKQRYAYPQLLGSWRLGFVSGTQTKRLRPEAKPASKPIKTVGKGRFLPRFITITITYEALKNRPTELAELDDIVTRGLKQAGPLGYVRNSVRLKGLHLQLTGPTRYWPATNSLGFDFTAIKVGLGPLTAYDGPVRGGLERDQSFQTQSIKDQAFFTFFYVEDTIIAARGKGGGLALWVRQ